MAWLIDQEGSGNIAGATHDTGGELRFVSKIWIVLNGSS